MYLDPTTLGPGGYGDGEMTPTIGSRRALDGEGEGASYLSPPRASPAATARKVDPDIHNAQAGPSTNRSGKTEDFRRPAPASLPPRRPAANGSIGDGLKGFQFPLVSRSSESGPGAGPSAGPFRPSAPPLMRNQSAQPFSFGTPLANRSAPTPGGGVAASPIVPRPAMLRQASVAVMEGRAAGQNQANVAVQKELQSLASVQEDARVVVRDMAKMGDKGGLALPPPPVGRFERSAGMGRSRSGSRLDDAPPLRELIKVSFVYDTSNLH